MKKMLSEKEKQRRRDYYYANREKMLAAHKKWRLANIESARKKVQQWSKAKFKEDPQYRWSTYLQVKLSKGVRDIADGYFPEQRKVFIGCTWKELKEWFEGFFESGMGWENYGKVWTVDHVVPRKAFDLRDEKERLRCFYWRNLRPMWKGENYQAKDFVMPVRDLNEPVPEPTEALKWEMANGTPRCSGRKKAAKGNGGPVKVVGEIPAEYRVYLEGDQKLPKMPPHVSDPADPEFDPF